MRPIARPHTETLAEVLAGATALSDDMMMRATASIEQGVEALETLVQMTNLIPPGERFVMQRIIKTARTELLNLSTLRARR